MTAEKPNDIIEGAKNILGEHVFNSVKSAIRKECLDEIADNEKYNGWTNKATWLIVSCYMDNIDAILENIPYEDTDFKTIEKWRWMQQAADALKDEFMDHIYDSPWDKDSIEFCLLLDACYDINWREIAEVCADERREWPNE